MNLKYILTTHSEKLLNTLIWLFLPKEKVLVVNTFLKNNIWGVKKENFGDDINYMLIRKLSQRRVISYMYSYLSFFKPVNYMCIGSIIEGKTNSRSVIWGSGAMFGDRDLKEKPLEVLAVRGPLTREYLLTQGVSCPEIYGDPAILLPIVFPCSRKKKYKLGLIPHFIDRMQENVLQLEKLYANDIVVIDLKNYKRWEDIVTTINECECIASSSLHGIIVSDAYGIPNVWIKLSNNIKGGNFKFQDYFLSCGREITAPLDFCGRMVDVEIIKVKVKSYKKPNYDIRKLLDVCPFFKMKEIKMESLF